MRTETIDPSAADIAIVGAGAAGLMAGIWAGRSAPGARVVLLDGARKLGAKILIAGGGRCNVTHDVVSADAYAGASRHAIRKVLRRFDVPETVQFFAEIGVDLKREETGKLFPTTDSARTVLNALLGAAERAGCTLRHPCRVATIERRDGSFVLSGDWGQMTATRLILATGGRSIPKSGSDGHGYALARALGHSVTTRIFPALVPLTLPRDHFLCGLSGITLPAQLTVRRGSGKIVQQFTDSTLLTHFGLSGPAVLDVSRHLIAAQFDDPAARLHVNWLPAMAPAAFEADLLALGKATALAYLRERLPDRLAQALIAEAGIDGNQMTRAQRKALIALVTDYPLPVTGNRGYNYAEVTAGGVPLTELQLTTMGSRVCHGLYLCGEICDVDGRIGGYNFQWAWASGFVAGSAAGEAVALLQPTRGA